MNHSGVVKRRINRVMREVDGLAQQLTALSDELPVPDAAELEAMLAGRRPFTYEALLLGLLRAINFYLAEATVSLWDEGFSRYRPSTFNGEISDPHILQALRNAMAARART
jgi:hypothetical protein